MSRCFEIVAFIAAKTNLHSINNLSNHEKNYQHHFNDHSISDIRV